MPSSTSAGHFGHTVDIDLRYREQPVHGIVRTTEPDLSHYFCSSQLRGTPRRSYAEEGHTRPSLALLRSTGSDDDQYVTVSLNEIVIPEGAGLCQHVVDQWFCWLSASVRAAPGEGPGSRRSARSVARTNGLDAGPARCMLSADAGGAAADVPSCDGADTLGQGRIGPAAGHPFAQLCGHGAVRWQHAGPIKWATTPGRGSDSAAAARVLRPGCSRRSAGGQGADVPVAQPVVDQGEQFACRGDLGDVLAAA